MAISIEEVRHVAQLARLELDESEAVAFQGELNAILGHFMDIQDVDVRDVQPSSHALAIQNVWSEDTPWDCLPRELALRNAKVAKAGLFVVPAIIED